MEYHLALMAKFNHYFPFITLKNAKLKFLSEVGMIIPFDNILSILQRQVEDDSYYGIEIGRFSYELKHFFKFEKTQIDKFLWVLNAEPSNILKSNFQGYLDFISYLVSKFEHGNYQETRNYLKNSVKIYLSYF